MEPKVSVSLYDLILQRFENAVVTLDLKSCLPVEQGGDTGACIEERNSDGIYQHDS